MSGSGASSWSFREEDFKKIQVILAAFLRESTAKTSLIVRSDRSAHPPYGLAGGRPGTVSSNLLQRPDGSEEVLASADKREVAAGDVFWLETPGGGGYG